MSDQRTVMLLGVAAALLADPVLAPMLNGRVYVERISTFQSSEPVPVILLYAGVDGGPAFSRNNGGPDYDRTCELIMEIAMRVIDDDGLTVSVAPTDVSLARKINTIESRIVGLKDDRSNPGLFAGNNPFSKLLYAHVVRRAVKVESVPYTDDSAGEKYAVRVLTMNCEMLTQGNDKLAPTLSGSLALLPASARALAEITPLPAFIADELNAWAADLVAPAPDPAFLGMDFALEVSTGDPAAATDTPDATVPQFQTTQAQS